MDAPAEPKPLSRVDPARREGSAAGGDLSGRPDPGDQQALRPAGAGRSRHHAATSTACWMRFASAPSTGRAWCTAWTVTPPGAAAARPHARHRRQAGGAVPRPRHRQDLLGCRCRPSGSGRGPHRPAAEAGRRRPRRAHRTGGTRRPGWRPRHHRLPDAGPCRPQAGLAGTEAADRPHPSASRALRRHQGAHPGRREIRGARPEHGLLRFG